MHVISKKALRDFWSEHPDSQDELMACFKNVNKAEWRNFADVKQSYGKASIAGDFVIFNISGNKYRIIAEIFYEQQVVLTRFVMTHAAYDQYNWKMIEGTPRFPTATTSPEPPKKKNGPRR